MLRGGVFTIDCIATCILSPRFGQVLIVQHRTLKGWFCGSSTLMHKQWNEQYWYCCQSVYWVCLGYDRII